MKLIIMSEAEKIVFVDESGLNRELRREYARAKRGVKVYDTKRGRRFERVNIIGAKFDNEHIAVRCYRH